MEGIQPGESVDRVVNRGGSRAEDLMAETKRMLEDLTEKLREEIDAHGKTKAIATMARKWEAELRIFEQAESGHEQRAKDLLASLESSE